MSSVLRKADGDMSRRKAALKKALEDLSAMPVRHGEVTISITAEHEVNGIKILSHI